MCGGETSVVQGHTVFCVFNFNQNINQQKLFVMSKKRYLRPTSAAMLLGDPGTFGTQPGKEEGGVDPTDPSTWGTGEGYNAKEENLWEIKPWDD